MTTRLNKLALTAAFISPLLLAAPASANTTTLRLDQAAVTQLTSSVQDIMTAYSHLSAGDKIEARVRLDAALSQMQSAVNKDRSLGLANMKATALHNELKQLRSKLNTENSTAVQAELRSVLTRAGIQLPS